VLAPLLLTVEEAVRQFLAELDRTVW